MNEADLLQATHDSEQAVLGSLLIDRDAIVPVSAVLVPEAFKWASHRVVYDAALALWERRVPCDASTVLAEVRAMGYGEDRFPADYLGRLMAATPTAVHAEFYARNVMQFARRRAIAEAGAQFVQAAYGPEDGTDTAELIAGFRRNVEAFEPADEHATVALEDYAEERAMALVETWNGSRTTDAIPTGLPYLDRMLNGGFRPGQLIVIGARPGMGKTAIAIRLCLKQPSHLVSLEMVKDEIVDRMTAQYGDVPYRVAHDLIGDVALRDRWLTATEAVGRLPVTIADRARQTTLQIESELARLVAERGVRLCVIDHLDWLGDKIKTDSQEARTAELIHRCKQMARALGIPVVVLAQLNRNVEHRPGFVPFLSDFRNSGAIEQDADVALLLYRRRYYSERGMLAEDANEDWVTGSNLHRAELIVAKNRNGAIGTVRLGWQPEVMDFREAA